MSEKRAQCGGEKERMANRSAEMQVTRLVRSILTSRNRIAPHHLGTLIALPAGPRAAHYNSNVCGVEHGQTAARE